jgi:hypothetical protein
VRPSRWPTLVALVVLAGLVGWLVADQAYGDLATLPAAAPFTALVIALFEAGLARVVWRKVRRIGGGRPMHPLQVARAAALAKASSATGALLLGFYGGFFLWAIERTELRAARHDAWASGWSALGCLLLLVAGLLLERSCRTPTPRDEMPTWTSTS